MCLNLYNIGIFSIVQTTEMLISTGGNLAISGINTFIAYHIFISQHAESTPYGSLGLVFLISYLTCSAILTIWDLATDCVM